MDSGVPQPVDRTAALNMLMSGGVGVLPTDTIYGLVARAADRQAVARLYALKHREHKPGTVIAASVEQLLALGLTAKHLDAVKRYWPAALSVVLPVGAALDYLDQEVGSLAVRIPDNAALRALLEQTGPLLTSSANQPGEPNAVTVTEAQAYFGGQVDFYVDGGDLSGHQPSTVARLTDHGLEILRHGAFTLPN